MGQKTKKGKTRLDKYYHLAKEQGFRSRAAFKLIQLNRKYGFLNSCRTLLDLCAAPGGWMQVAAKTLPVGSLILGVDLVPIKPIRGCKTLLADITTQPCRQLIKKELAGNMMDCVVHDGAPNVGGAWASEAYNQAALVLEALKLATEVLAPRGSFVTKIFRSKDYNALLYALNQLFDKVEATKPSASRNTSAEIFVVCLGYKAPSKIDPRLLDPRHLFQEVTEVKKVQGPDALIRQKIKQVRHREGYEEGISTTRKVIPALGFLLAENAVEALGTYTSIALHGTESLNLSGASGVEKDWLAGLAERVRSHPQTDIEVQSLCADLQVLGRSEFKHLIKWRLALCKELKEDLAQLQRRLGGEDAEEDEEEREEGEDEGPEGEGADDPEEKLLKEMADIHNNMNKRVKKEAKKRRELKIKSKLRAAQMLESEGITDDGSGGRESLFSLSTLEVARKGKVEDMREIGSLDEEQLHELEQNSDDELVGEDEGSDLDSEEERQRYDEELDEQLEENYKDYLKRHGEKLTDLKIKRARLEGKTELDAEDEEEELEDGEDQVAEAGPPSDDEDVEDGGDQGLLVSLDETRAGVPRSSEAMAAQWFGQDIFADPDLQVEGPPRDQVEPPLKKKKKEKEEGASGAGARTPLTNGHADAFPPQVGMNGCPGSHAASGVSRKNVEGEDDDDKDDGAGAGPSADVEDFEVVPQARGDADDASSSESEDEFDRLDDHGKAEVLALAKKMLRRREREDIMDASYNRFSFHDDNLPRWFAEDERRHRQALLPVSKQEVEEEKKRLQAIDARPIKKVAEAKARKRKRTQVQLNKARERANAIAEQEDVPMASKMREIQKLYAKARATGKGKKGGKGRDKKRKGPPLDRRMLADKRGQDKAQRKMGGKKKKGGVVKRAGAKGGRGGKGRGK